MEEDETGKLRSMVEEELAEKDAVAAWLIQGEGIIYLKKTGFRIGGIDAYRAMKYRGDSEDEIVLPYSKTQYVDLEGVDSIIRIVDGELTSDNSDRMEIFLRLDG